MKIKTKQSEVWSIGLYKIASNNGRISFSTSKSIQNPILTAKDITDRKAEFVADPFLVYENGAYYLFFEVCGNGKENIGLAISKDGHKWEYQKIVLDEPFNVAYPCVFLSNTKYYMTPETYKTNTVRLYEANEFPFKWKFVKTLVEGRDFGDPAIIRYKDKWWLFVSSADSANLYLYYSDALEGVWQAHPKSPIIRNNPTRARPAGNILLMDGKIIRVAQDDSPYYGKSVRAFSISILSQEEYEEFELDTSPWFVPSGKGWNKDGMHHFSICKINEKEFLSCVDGKIHRKKILINTTVGHLLDSALNRLNFKKL